jgi:hypothetical protein
MKGSPIHADTHNIHMQAGMTCHKSTCTLHAHTHSHIYIQALEDMIANLNTETFQGVLSEQNNAADDEKNNEDNNKNKQDNTNDEGDSKDQRNERAARNLHAATTAVNRNVEDITTQAQCNTTNNQTFPSSSPWKPEAFSLPALAQLTSEIIANLVFAKPGEFQSPPSASASGTLGENSQPKLGSKCPKQQSTYNVSEGVSISDVPMVIAISLRDVHASAATMPAQGVMHTRGPVAASVGRQEPSGIGDIEVEV